MTNYVRRLVSGGKARFRDEGLDMELDLVYLTDRVVIMGFPAVSLESWYRNDRNQVKTFLESRHGEKYRVFNFCPIKENSYLASEFDGRVSRFPFPDHHAPPLGLLALASRDMKAWLDRDPENVVVLHCKAGKGRSGTLACSLLLYMDDKMAPPKLKRSYNASEWADDRAEAIMEDIVVETDAPPSSIEGDSELPSSAEEGSKGHGNAPKPTTDPLGKSKQAGKTDPKALLSVNRVLDLHTSRRMKTGNKHGVSIPSQRRWLRYWSEFLHHAAPPQLPLYPSNSAPSPKARLYSVKIRMREEGGGAQVAVVRVANALIERTPLKSGRKDRSGDVWVSLARYDDDMVNEIDEKVRKGDAIEYESDNVTVKNNMFATSKWDSGKMVKSFARMGMPHGAKPQSSLDAGGPLLEHTLLPLPPSEWVDVVGGKTDDDMVMTDIQINDGILLDSGREVRIKFYNGQLLFGWMWLVPMYHLPQPPSAKGEKTTILLQRADADFPLGYGVLLVDIEITLGWDIETTDEEASREPERSQSGHTSEPKAGGVLAAMGGNVEALQGARD